MLYDSEFQKAAQYMPDAYCAALRSKVTKKQMGAILIGKVVPSCVWQVIADGCNGVGYGHDHVFEENGKTGDHVIHAEINALNKLKYLGIDTKQQFEKVVLLITSAPCPKCCKAIIESGIIDSVLWVEDNKLNEGVDTLVANGIDCYPLSVFDKRVLATRLGDANFFAQCSLLQHSLERRPLDSTNFRYLGLSTTKVNEAYEHLKNGLKYVTTDPFITEIDSVDQYRCVRFALLRAFKYWAAELKNLNVDHELLLNEFSVDNKTYLHWKESDVQGDWTDRVVALRYKLKGIQFDLVAYLESDPQYTPVRIIAENICKL